MHCIRHIVDYCAYGFAYKKPTHIWSSLKTWTQKGLTGGGRCGKCCPAGGWYTNSKGQRVHVHDVGLARDPDIGIRGQGATQKLNAIPQLLVQEWLEAAIQERKSDQQNVVIDLCCGYGSVLPVANKMGMKYIGVDVKDRMVQKRPSA